MPMANGKLKITDLAGLLLFLLVVSSGCESMRHRLAFHRPVAAELCVLAADATKDDIVNHLNDHIGKLYAWRSDDVKITAKQHGVPISMAAKMAVESPRRLRLVVGSLAGNEVDLGSNPERFWFWMRRSDVHGIMTASYDDVEAGKPLGPVPFQPEWLIESLGVIPITSDDFQMSERPGTPRCVALTSDQVTPAGKTVRRTMIVDVGHGTIAEHTLRDASGQLIARALLSQYQRERNGARLPHRIDLHWPDNGVELTLRIGQIEVNPVNVAEQIWEMPSYPDSPVIDLTRFRPR